MKGILSLLFILCLAVSATAQQPDWYLKLMRVKPLESTREDVEKIFAGLKVQNAYVARGREFVFYNTAEGDLSLEYSIGNCSAQEAPFDVKKGKVIEAFFRPSKRGIKLSKFKINRSDFYIEKERDNPGLHYINQDLGIFYGVQNERVYYIIRFPPSKFDSLKCEYSNKK